MAGLVACSDDSREPALASPSSAPTSAIPSVTPETRATPVAPEPIQIGEVTGLDAPWGLAFLPDGRALITERDKARVLLVDADGVEPLTGAGAERIADDTDAGGEGGLLGLAVSPNFDADGFVFVYLTADGDNRILRLRLDPERGRLTRPNVILDGIPKGTNHNGGRLAFGPDGHLYATTGDTYETSLSQNRESLGGKILRITVDGDPAPGNPFGNEVWTFGHRNVQGIAWTKNGRMFASEFGQNSWDELNEIRRGANHGWPDVEGRNPAGTDPVGEEPLVIWTTAEASPSGIAVHRGSVYVAGLRGQRLWKVPIERDGVGEPSVALDGMGRLRDVVAGPDGALWVLTNNTDGRGDPREGDDRLVRFEP